VTAAPAGTIVRPSTTIGRRSVAVTGCSMRLEADETVDAICKLRAVPAGIVIS
jgi:hypothetical protein